MSSGRASANSVGSVKEKKAESDGGSVDVDDNKRRGSPGDEILDDSDESAQRRSRRKKPKVKFLTVR